jgi:hypothetical protein
MKLGEVYFWATDKAEGHGTRNKYHIFICPKDQVEDNTFLFINTMDWYNDFKLLKTNYAFLSYDSFVGCNAVVTYTDAELLAATPSHDGKLTKDDLKGLRDAIIAAETMEQRHATRVCAALAAAL